MLTATLERESLDTARTDQPLAGQPASVTFLPCPGPLPRRRAETPGRRAGPERTGARSDGPQPRRRSAVARLPASRSVAGRSSLVVASPALGWPLWSPCVAEVGPDCLCGAGSVAVVDGVLLGARGPHRRPARRRRRCSRWCSAWSCVVSDDDALRTGAAVLTCVVSAVLAVMATVPAVRFVQAVREVVIAVLIAAVGALATVGFEPVVTVARFEYVTLGLALRRRLRASSTASAPACTGWAAAASSSC